MTGFIKEALNYINMHNIIVLVIDVPSHCICETSFSVDHAMVCWHGGLTFIPRNEPRDLTADWLKEVFQNVAQKH